VRQATPLACLSFRNVAGVWLNGDPIARKKGETDMNNIFYIIGVVVVVLFIAGYFGLR
jgi:hypothetical protein